MCMEIVFEWDDEKARANERKHGVSFAEASLIWTDAYRFEARQAFSQEARYLAVGKTAKHRFLSAVITYRGPNQERIRIISARLASKKEIGKYYEKRFG